MNSMSIDEFAEKAEVSRRTVHRWIDSGRVVSEKRGKARVILVDGDVSIYMMAQMSHSLKMAQMTQMS